MRTRAEILQQYFGVGTYRKAHDVWCLTKEQIPPRQPLSNFTKLTLPFHVGNNSCIPSVEEIEKAMADKTSRLDVKYAYRPVCRIGDMIVKKDTDLSLVQEAEDMFWLQENTQVRVPKLYAIFSHEHDGSEAYYLVMERLEGYSFNSNLWATLSSTQKESVHFRLAEQLNILRAVPSEGYYGRVNKLPYFSRYCYTETTVSAPPCGPYNTYEDLVNAMWAAVEFNAAFSDSRKPPSHMDIETWNPDQIAMLSNFRDVLTQANGHEPTLTHLDPGMGNWIVRPLDGDGTLQDATDYEFTFIDWNRLGWYPAWMQRLTLDYVSNFVVIDGGNIYRDNEGMEQFENLVRKYFGGDYEHLVEYEKMLIKHLGYSLV